jgi:hypothetical protein
MSCTLALFPLSLPIAANDTALDGEGDSLFLVALSEVRLAREILTF